MYEEDSDDNGVTDSGSLRGDGRILSIQNSVKRVSLKLIAQHSIPVTSDLGIAGIPQSATGQTAIFTGKNAAEVMNGHMPGFPGPTLRQVISQGNLFSKMLEKGFKVTFANAYVQHSLEQLTKHGLRSVTTVHD